jgi:hypothetical protein
LYILGAPGTIVPKIAAKAWLVRTIGKLG